MVSDFREGTTPASGVVSCALARHLKLRGFYNNASSEGTGGDTRGGCGPPLDSEPFQPRLIFVLFMRATFTFI